MNKSCIVERIISNHFESFFIHKKINNGHHSIYQFVSKNTYYILKFDNKSITKKNMLRVAYIPIPTAYTNLSKFSNKVR